MIDLLVILVGTAIGYAAWRASSAEMMGRDHPYWDDPED